MAATALIDAFIHGDSHDFTVDTNTVQLEGTAADLDSTTFASAGWSERAGGLKNGSLHVEGFWIAGTNEVDPVAFAGVGVSSRVWTVGPVETEGQPAYILNAETSNYQLFGAVGELTPFAIDGQQSGNAAGIVRGQLAKARGNVSATGVLGSVVNLGATGAAQFVYCSVHVFSAGTTITLQLQSDNASGFPSPATVATIGPITAAGGTFMTRVAGPLTDTHWRLNVSAITGTFNVAAAIAVQ